MKRILGIWSSDKQVSVWFHGQEIFIEKADGLGPAVRRFLKGQRSSPSEAVPRKGGPHGGQRLDGVGVSIGPGSFTGIRVGVSFARTLGQVLKIPVFGIVSLDAMAAGYPEKELLSPVIEAGRGEVYTALYVNGEREGEVQLLPLEKWLQTLAKKEKTLYFVSRTMKELQNHAKKEKLLPFLSKAQKALLGDYNMIKHINSQNLSGFDKPFRKPDVVFGGLKISRGVIVRQ